MNEKEPVATSSFKIIDVIRYPDITKKMSTPINPPLNVSKSKIVIWAWYKITEITAIALKPSISGLYFPIGLIVGSRLSISFITFNLKDYTLLENNILKK